MLLSCTGILPSLVVVETVIDAFMYQRHVLCIWQQVRLACVSPGIKAVHAVYTVKVHKLDVERRADRFLRQSGHHTRLIHVLLSEELSVIEFD